MKNTTPTQSYDGEQIYVGIDVHKKTDVVVARVKQVIVKKWSTAAQPADLAAQLLLYGLPSTNSYDGDLENWD